MESNNRIQIHLREHLGHSWRVHSLLQDFEIEDVWQFPVVLRPEHDLACFREQFKAALEQIGQRGVAGWLFKLRMFLGDIFGWDQKTTKKPLLPPGSIRERYAKSEGVPASALPDPGQEEFIPVYDLGEESLAEIENATVHAALHLGRVSLDQNRYGVQMAVYVKPKGLLGQTYMALIKPFRLWIVYPAMMRMVSRQWERFLNDDSVLFQNEGI